MQYIFNSNRAYIYLVVAFLVLLTIFQVLSMRQSLSRGRKVFYAVLPAATLLPTSRTENSAISSVRHFGSFGSKISKSGYSSSALSSLVESTDVAVRSQYEYLHPSYEVVEKFTIPEYGLEGIYYLHKKTGAQVISIISPDDNNKVFGITFRTPPADSTGVPHVLEHSVLCGSRKFPVKEPFVDLLKGSLQNFLNAFTYPDRTCYPVASTNTKDFYNLVHVYLDAVLHPRALQDPKVLQQEGWHYELEDPSEPLTFKGVVYNEMKGVYSSPDSLMGRATQQALFPSNTYGVDSGGDPLKIPDLSFDQFKAFHAAYYHPSNSRVFFYGNDDPIKRLDLLDEYLADFEKQAVTSAVAFQPKFADPQRLQVGFPIDPAAPPKHMLTVSWLLNDKALDSKEMLALGVLDYLLLGTSSSSVRKILTKSQLGESVTGGGLSDELLQSTFSVGLKGVKAEDVDRVEQLVLSTMAKLSEEGFETDAIQAAMNTFEFRLREFNTGSFPRGLSLMLGMMNNWIYDKNPVEGVLFEAPLKALKEDIAAGKPVFQDLLKKYVVSNQHRVTVEMKPDLTLEDTQRQEEESRLAKVKEGMTEQQVLDTIQLTKELKEAQQAEDSPEAKATLPKLGLEDIDPIHKEIPYEIVSANEDSQSAMIITHSLQTSGILYADVALDYSDIDLDDLELLPLFSRMLMETGTATYDQTALSRRIGANTGGIGVSYHNDLRSAAGKVANSDDVLLFLMLRGKAVTDNVSILFDLFLDILQNSKLDSQKRAVEMLKESKARKEAAVLSSGHTFAATRLAGRSSLLGHLNEVTGGLTSLREAGRLLQAAESDWPALHRRLEKLRQAIVKRGKVVVNLTGDQQMLQTALPTVNRFVQSLPAAKQGGAKSELLAQWETQRVQKLLPLRDEAFTMPSQVNYVVMGGPIYSPGESVKASTSVIARYLSTGYLWDQVRVVGGAYGGFARFSESTGRFVFLSYRDPNLLNTLNVYESTAEALRTAEVSKEDILQALIGTVGDLDSPLAPDQKGFTSLVQLLSGETARDRQRRRDEILATNTQDFQDFALRMKRLQETSSVAVFGSQQAVEAANKELKDRNKPLVVEPAFLGK